MSTGQKKKIATGNPLGTVARPIEAPAVHTAAIMIPIGKLKAEAYRTRHIDVRLSGTQAKGLRHLTDSLDVSGAKLDNGKRVCTAFDSVRWLIEQAGKIYDRPERSEAPEQPEKPEATSAV